MEDTRSNRLEHIDIGAGIMILWLLWYHALWPIYESRVLETIPWLFFFMPWFFYKSGYFFTSKPIKATIKKDAGKLLWQYMIWSIIGYAYYIVSLYLYDELTLKTIIYRPLHSLFAVGAVPANRSLWFLPILFVVHQMVNVLSRKISLLWIGIVSMLIAIGLYLPDFAEMPRPLYATFWGMCFFSFGAYLRKYEQNKYVILLSVIILLIAFLFTTTPTVYDQRVDWYMYIYWYPACIAGCIIFNNVCRCIHTYIHTWRGYLLNLYMGRASFDADICGAWYTPRRSA